MPRIYDSRSNPIDFCTKCFPKSETKAFTKYGTLGNGPDERGNCFGYDAEHPAYKFADYQCDVCGKQLTEKDDYYGG